MLIRLRSQTLKKLLFTVMPLLLYVGLSHPALAEDTTTKNTATENTTTETTTTENQVPTEKNSENSSAPAPTPEKTDTKQKPTASAKKQSNNKSTDDTFIPSEEVSEDLSVSFPVDI